MRTYLIVMMLLMAIRPSFAQDHEQYRVELRKAIQKMKNLDKVSQGGFFLMDIQLKMTPKKGFQQVVHPMEAKDIRLKMILGEEFLLYETEFFSIYQDRQDIYQVFHPDKLIVQQAVPKGTFQQYEGIIKTMDQLNDELFEEGRLLHVSDVILEGKPVKKMHFNLSRKGIETYGIRSTTYWYHPKSGQIVKQLSVFVDDHPMQRQEVTYHHIDPDYKGKFPRTARSAVLDKSSRLLPQYQGYRLETTE